MIRNQCQLITYADSLGKNLQELSSALETTLQGLFGGVHILPFYPSTADRGFAPLEYRTVNPAFGSWEDIEKIAKNYDLIVDFMFNHISRQSVCFQDFLRKKDRSKYKDMFIRYPAFWPGGEPTQEEMAKIYTRKPRPPYTNVTFSDGTAEKIWCTFDEEQIDLNTKSQESIAFIEDNLQFLCRMGAKVVRLDAFAYAAKKPGTNCFFVEPDVWELLREARNVVEPFGVDLLPEIHEHHSVQLKLADRGYSVYDFALPMLVLQALYDGDSRNLERWLRICPRKQFTTLDTHDGIGIVDIVDLMTSVEIERTKENLYAKGANIKKIYSSQAYNNLDIYQINCTYYSALGNRDDAYLLARAIQFFTPGIPQIYYVGLLAGENDIELLEKTKMGRDINRHYYSLEEIGEKVGRKVVQNLFKLMRFRNRSSAFNGDMTLEDCDNHELRIMWRMGMETARLSADLRSRKFTIEENGGRIVYASS